VYATRHGDRLAADKCSRTRPLGRASQDLAYFDGQARGRQQGVVFGAVVHRGRDRDGQPALISTARDAGYVVVARVEGRRHAVHVDWSTFDLVLPAGAATVWVERAGRPASPEVAVSVPDGGEHPLMLITDEPAP
jgi:hypothetical protein